MNGAHDGDKAKPDAIEHAGPPLKEAHRLWHQRSWVREALRTCGAAAFIVAFCASGLLVWPQLYWQDDMLNQYLPATRDVSRAIVHGEWPILTQLCWHGASLAGEYQHAVFSVFEVLLATIAWSFRLSAPATAPIFVLTHIAVLAAGVFRLARSRGLAPLESLFATSVACLNGWLITWGATTWYPALTSFAWLPWTWWTLETAIRARKDRPWSFAPAGIFVYLILSAGWPFTCLMTAVVSAWVAIRCAGSQRTIWAAWPVAAAWVVGLGLSAPAWAMLLDYMPQTLRGNEPMTINLAMIVPVEGFLGIALPSYYCYWHNIYNWATRPSLELAGALAPLATWLVALAFHGRSLLRQQRAELALLALCTVFATTPSAGSFRFSFRWLPLFHLVLGIVGAQGLALLRNIRDERAARRAALAPAATSVLLTGMTWARALLMGLDPSPTTLRLGGRLLALTVLWLIVDLFASKSARARYHPMLGFVLASLAVTYDQLPPNGQVARWAIAPDETRRGPLDRNVRYLSVYTWSDLMRPEWDADRQLHWVMDAGGLRPGYTSMYAGLRALGGYSGMSHVGLSALFEFGIQGETSERGAGRMLSEATKGGPFLQLLGVDGLIVHKRYEGLLPALEAGGWHLVARIPNAFVLHRNGPPSPQARSISHAQIEPTHERLLDRLRNWAPGDVPVLLAGPPGRPSGNESFAEARVELLSHERHRSIARVQVPAGQRPALLVFARPWLEGWRATLDGHPLEVEPVNALLPAVRVPPGARGEVIIEYSPPALRRGLACAAATLVLAICAIAWLVRRSARFRLSGAHMTGTRQ